jgi:hypothetical protein
LAHCDHERVPPNLARLHPEFKRANLVERVNMTIAAQVREALADAGRTMRD